ncbi:MAG: cytochrome c oxidase subunit II [Acetobacteraceae bacterium]|nr:cytochrome c oxidase subunit II [Acetobacteraceae bacterium]
MTFGEIARKRLHFLFLLIAVLVLLPLSHAALAQPAGSAPPPSNASGNSPHESAQSPNVVNQNTPPAALATPLVGTPAPGAKAAYRGLDPHKWIKGQPEPGAYWFQPQYSDDGRYAKWFHNTFLMPVITAISLLVLVLLLWVIVFYNRRSHPVPSRTSHNTLLEVAWTVLPALILVVIAVPSMILLNKQYRSPPKNALTIKATGYQWYWGYTYADNGGFEVISNVLPDAEADKRGEPRHLGADNRMVVPVGEPIRLQTTGADVIHSFSVPSLWFKLDAVPGRLNERVIKVDEPGIYYGQCSELCGARHAYMPIVVEAVPRPQFEAFIRAQGGTVGVAAAAAGAAGAAPAPAPTAAPSKVPESAVEGAPGAGANPTKAPVAQPAAATKA